MSLKQLSTRFPRGTWDTHMHVIDPRFPLSFPQYSPKPHTLSDAEPFYNALGIHKKVIVQPSIYGFDNSCTLDALRRFGKSSRAIIQFDPERTSPQQLEEWNNLGVRGVRLNYRSINTEIKQDSLAAEIIKYANAVRHVGWILDLYLPMESIPLLEPLVADQKVNVCIAHFGHPSNQSLNAAQHPSDIPGFGSLMKMLKGGRTWIKLSAPYRLNADPRDPLMEQMCKSFVREFPERCLFATDWPHTRFESLDITPYLDALLDWIEQTDGEGLGRICVKNADELFE
ncbi:amidohydrolase 2 [Piedraia hortae CBS 480.64]|uniref:Amidohydrolase 2 n=1 Tax=Piedraia hortae CBS 480.64 TaxID=1314780 RepID=A0A6A7BT72_9PEZI|nr:amidohydrolase 2 [Piedraia hortae CBS 480.64]